KVPLVFAHGLFGFDQLALGPKSMPLIFNYWRGITEVLKERGTEVLVARVPASASIQERAEALRDVIERHFGGREINLIGHSMGGLDSRYLISRLETSFTVKSLTTIATPHRGSPFADYMLQQVIGKDNIPSLLSLVRAVGIPGGGKAFEQLQLADMAKFNEEVSGGACCARRCADSTAGFLSEFRIPHGIIFAQEGPNDGLVSCSSAEWGEYRGTLAANHLELIG
ncbi:alpha/beta-hydrolase, partial [Tilletiopsis washingtonensis]